MFFFDMNIYIYTPAYTYTHIYIYIFYLCICTLFVELYIYIYVQCIRILKPLNAKKVRKVYGHQSGREGFPVCGSPVCDDRHK